MTCVRTKKWQYNQHAKEKIFLQETLYQIQVQQTGSKRDKKQNIISLHTSTRRFNRRAQRGQQFIDPEGCSLHRYLPGYLPHGHLPSDTHDHPQ